jgi:hypothetical protein
LRRDCSIPVGVLPADCESRPWPASHRHPHHPYPPVYIEKTGDVLKHTTHAFYDRLTNWKPSQAIEAMDKDGIAVSVLSIRRRASGSATPPRARLRAGVQ